MSKSKRNDYEDEDKQTIRKLKETVKELISQNKQLKEELAKIQDPKPVHKGSAKKHYQREQPETNIKQSEKQINEEAREQVRNKMKEWRERNYGKYREE